MRLYPAPSHHNPSGLRPVAAAGAGVQFATDPCRASWDEGYTGLGSGLTQNGNGTSPERVGGIQFSAGPGRSRGHRGEGWGLLIPIRL